MKEEYKMNYKMRELRPGEASELKRIARPNFSVVEQLFISKPKLGIVAEDENGSIAGGSFLITVNSGKEKIGCVDIVFVLPKYRGSGIEEVLALTIEQAMEFFSQPKIRKPLQSLVDVGLGYMTLGQPTSTLSGGESQRVKLASELNKTGNLYVLDEPSTGLHHEDIKRLHQIFRKLVSQGNTVVVIEHRLEMIAEADWVIDMGPGGGSDGGQIIFCGTPQNLLKSDRSITAEYLRRACGDS